MDIKERLRLEIAAGARGEWVADHCFKRLLDDALAEIFRLEGQLATYARASVDLTNELLMCKRELKWHTEQRGFKEIPHG